MKRKEKHKNSNYKKAKYNKEQYTTYKKIESKKENNKINDISIEEIKNLEKAIDEDYFYFAMDTLDLYDNNLIEIENLGANQNNIPINEKFFHNIPLNNIQNIKKLLLDIQTLNCNSNNYDFIKNKLLIDSNINNYEDYIKDNNDEEDFDAEVEEESDYTDENNKNNFYEEEDLIQKEKINSVFISYEKQ